MRRVLVLAALALLCALPAAQVPAAVRIGSFTATVPAHGAVLVKIGRAKQP